MASLSSRAKSAGRSRGFFGQLNRNIEKERDKKNRMEESVSNMRNQMSVYKAKVVYDSTQKDITDRRDHSRKFTSSGGVDANGNITQKGYRIMAQESDPNWGSYSDANRTVMANRMERDLGNPKYGDFLNKRYGKDGGADAVQGMKAADPRNINVTREVDNIIGANAETSRAGAFAGTPMVSQEVSAVSGEGVGSVDPFAFVLDPVEVSRTDDITLPSGAVVSRNFDKFGNVVGEDTQVSPVPAAETDELGPARKVNLVVDGKAQVGAELEVRLNKSDNVLEINTGPDGAFEPLGNRKTTPSSKVESRAKAANDEAFLLSDVELRSVAAIDNAQEGLNELANLAKLQDSGALASGMSFYNRFQEALTANRIGPGDPTTTVSELMAQMDEAVAAGMLKDAGLTPEQKLRVQEIALMTPSEAQQIDFDIGQINAMKAFLPIMLAKATTDSTRLPIQQVEMFANIINPRPGTRLAGGLSVAQKTMTSRKKHIYNQRYTQDRSPSYLKAGGWEFRGGEMNIKETDTGLMYGIYHPGANYTTWRPVGSQPNPSELNRELKAAKKRAGIK